MLSRTDGHNFCQASSSFWASPITGTTCLTGQLLPLLTSSDDQTAESTSLYSLVRVLPLTRIQQDSTLLFPITAFRTYEDNCFLSRISPLLSWSTHSSEFAIAHIRVQLSGLIATEGSIGRLHPIGWLPWLLPGQERAGWCLRMQPLLGQVYSGQGHFGVQRQASRHHSFMCFASIMLIQCKRGKAAWFHQSV